MGLRLDQFNFELPEELIAQSPKERRDQSRLMVLDRANGKIDHRLFCDLPELLNRDDLMVVNDTCVIPARFFCRRKTGGRIEGLFVSEKIPGRWEVMLRGAGRCKAGEIFDIVESDACRLKLAENLGLGNWLVEVVSDANVASAAELLERFGRTPLPPYIRRKEINSIADEQDRQRYQTVFAARRGAVAAPTAGLHFTDELLNRIDHAGIERATVTLHVGPGTFAPVKSEDISLHKMHSEWFDLPAGTAEKINAAKAAGRRTVAVGTTSVRVLETAAKQNQAGRICDNKKASFDSCSGWTDIFIYPPAEFRAIDALITNFHLPGSTLLMLVAAFCSPGTTDGIALILDAYKQAVAEKYRFFSYGDAMLII